MCYNDNSNINEMVAENYIDSFFIDNYYDNYTYIVPTELIMSNINHLQAVSSTCTE